MKLERIAGSIDRFDAIDHRAAHAVNEIAIEERDGLIEFFIQFDSPLLPLFMVKIAHRHSSTGSFEDVAIIGSDQFAFPDVVRSQRGIQVA